MGDCRSLCWGEGRAGRVVEMSNSDCGDRGLATRRGVCVSELRHNYHLLPCTPALSQSPVLWHDLAHGSDLHEAIPFPRLPASTCALQQMQRPEFVSPEQWRVRPGPWTGLSTTAAGLLPTSNPGSLKRLQFSTVAGVLALNAGLCTLSGGNSKQCHAFPFLAHGSETRLSRGQGHLLPGEMSITCRALDDLGQFAQEITNIQRST